MFSFCVVLVSLLLTLNIFFALFLIVDFEQVNVCQDNCNHIIIVVIAKSFKKYLSL